MLRGSSEPRSCCVDKLSSFRNPHGQPAARLGGESLDRPRLRCRGRIEAETRQKHGEHDDGLLHRKACTDADPGSHPERQVLKAIYLLALAGMEAFRQE